MWLLKHFGTECNLGNIAPADVLSLETLRLGLRSDTVERFALGGDGLSAAGEGGARRPPSARPRAGADPLGGGRLRACSCSPASPPSS